jgi:hypothetical protein
MKARVATLGLVVAFAFLFASSASAADPLQTSEPSMMTKKAPAKKKTRAKGKAMRGVPTGVPACLDHLIEMASADPMTPYEGHPQEIINNGLLWNDAKSKCSIGSDALRLKVSEAATAWRLKNAEKVKSLLQEIKSAAP